MDEVTLQDLVEALSYCRFDATTRRLAGVISDLVSEVERVHPDGHRFGIVQEAKKTVSALHNPLPYMVRQDYNQNKEGRS